MNVSLVSYTFQDIRYSRDILSYLVTSERHREARRHLPDSWLELAAPFIRTLDYLRGIVSRVLRYKPRESTPKESSSKGSEHGRRSFSACPHLPVHRDQPITAVYDLIQNLVRFQTAKSPVKSHRACDWIEYTRVVLYTLQDVVAAEGLRPDCDGWKAALYDLVALLLDLYQRDQAVLTAENHAAMEHVQALVLQLLDAPAACATTTRISSRQNLHLKKMIDRLLPPASQGVLSQWTDAVRNPAYPAVERFLAADLLSNPAAYVSLITALYAAVDAINDMAAVFPDPPSASSSASHAKTDKTDKTDADTYINILKSQFEVFAPSIARVNLGAIVEGLPTAVMGSVRYRIFEPLVNQYIRLFRRLYRAAGVENPYAAVVFAALEKHAYDNPVQLLPVYLDRARGALAALHAAFLKSRCAAGRRTA